MLSKMSNIVKAQQPKSLWKSCQVKSSSVCKVTPQANVMTPALQPLRPFVTQAQHRSMPPIMSLHDYVKKEFGNKNSIHKAMDTLSQVKNHVVISYNAFIRAYAQNNHIDQAMETYRQIIGMQIQNAFTYQAIAEAFKHCEEIEGIDQVASDLLNDVRVWEQAKNHPKEKKALLSACYTLTQLGATISAGAIKERLRIWDQ